MQQANASAAPGHKKVCAEKIAPARLITCFPVAACCCLCYENGGYIAAFGNEMVGFGSNRTALSSHSGNLPVVHYSEKHSSSPHSRIKTLEK
ncbi:hypothetical protein [Acetobacter vaccinii]|uniref:hypothetical protein n=1 Tax=Acetobacter vaccinii TaxID=2592655 RepID=UPI00143CF990|nr:hypothetical protein [Acetobacter vaccinii]